MDGIESCLKETRKGTWQNEELTSREVERASIALQQAPRQQTNGGLQYKELFLKKMKNKVLPEFLH